MALISQPVSSWLVTGPGGASLRCGQSPAWPASQLALLGFPALAWLWLAYGWILVGFRFGFRIDLASGFHVLGFGLDLIWIWLDFGWIWFGLGWIWLGFQTSLAFRRIFNHF